MKFLFVFIFPVLTTAGYYSQLQGQGKCSYDSDIRTYICTHITNLFPKIFYGNYHLKCVDCHILNFKKEIFPHDNSLISLNLTKSGIQTIEGEAFERLITLQYIFLEDNEITNIESNAFYGLRQVYELHLENNKIIQLKQKFLNGFEANAIILRNNTIKDIPDNIFEGIFGAMTLDLSYNKIYNLHVDSFKYLTGLEYLNLENNNLCSIPLGTFKHLKLLADLNLSNNKFKKFNYGVFSGLHNLKNFNLSYNNLVEFDASILIPMGDIVRLDISGNGLNYLDPIPLHINAPNLKTLGISDNLWSCNSLINIVQHLRSVNVHVIEHNVYDVTNIKGIACTDRKITDEKIPFETFYKVAKEFTENYNYC